MPPIHKYEPVEVVKVNAAASYADPALADGAVGELTLNAQGRLRVENSSAEMQDMRRLAEMSLLQSQCDARNAIECRGGLGRGCEVR